MAVASAEECDMKSPAHSVARSTVIARCAERRMARRFAVEQASRQVTFAGRTAQNSSRFTSHRPAHIAGSAVFAVRPSSAASISSRPFTDCRLVHWTTTRASSRRGTYSLRTRPHGMTSRTSYRSFQSFQQKLPNTAAQSDAFRSALNAPTPSAPGRER